MLGGDNHWQSTISPHTNHIHSLLARRFSIAFNFEIIVQQEICRNAAHTFPCAISNLACSLNLSLKLQVEHQTSLFFARISTLCGVEVSFCLRGCYLEEGFKQTQSDAQTRLNHFSCQKLKTRLNHFSCQVSLILNFATTIQSPWPWKM